MKFNFFHALLTNRKPAAVSLSACLSLFALAAQPAQAAPAWSPALQLSVPNALLNLQFDGSIALDPFGNSVAVWDANGFIEAASQTAGSQYTQAMEISQLVNDEVVSQPRVAISPLGNAIAVWVSAVGNRRTGVVYYVKAAYKQPKGAWSAPSAIAASSASGPAFGSPRIALDAAGNALAIWSSCDRNTTAATCVIQSASKPVGRAWSMPTNLSSVTNNASEAQLALSPLGFAVAIWREPNQSGTSVVKAVSKRPGRTWNAAVVVSQLANNYTPKVAIDAVGRAIVVWNQESSINAATLAVNGSWSAPVTLSANTVIRAADVGMDLLGTATVAWIENDPTSGSNLVQVATRAPSGKWSAAAAVSTTDQEPAEPRVATNPGGMLKVISWVDNNQNTAITTTKIGDAPWTTPVTLGAGLYDTAVELAATLGNKARALWALPIISPRGGEGWAPVVSSLTP